jgi:hypothetical protein
MTRFNAKLTWAIALAAVAMLGFCNKSAHAQTSYTTYTSASAATERYEVTPGRYENQWIPPVYSTALDSSGRPFTYVAQPGYSKQVYIEPVYAYRPCPPPPQTVYIQQTTYCPPPTVVVSQPVAVCAPAPVIYTAAPVYCPPPQPVYCPPPQPVIYCPPPQPVVYCPPPRPAVSISFGFISGGGGGCFPAPRCEPVFRPRPYCPPPSCGPRGYSSGTSVNVNVNVRSRR